eukprot:NODE_251_length_11743_cov_0.676788.p1 type:complete len:290 gc:universal NODE_251_length_11743_cov_0.676788:1976-1107(-)
MTLGEATLSSVNAQIMPENTQNSNYNTNKLHDSIEIVKPIIHSTNSNDIESFDNGFASSLLSDSSNDSQMNVKQPESHVPPITQSQNLIVLGQKQTVTTTNFISTLLSKLKSQITDKSQFIKLLFKLKQNGFILNCPAHKTQETIEIHTFGDSIIHAGCTSEMQMDPSESTKTPIQRCGHINKCEIEDLLEFLFLQITSTKDVDSKAFSQRIHTVHIILDSKSINQLAILPLINQYSPSAFITDVKFDNIKQFNLDCLSFPENWKEIHNPEALQQICQKNYAQSTSFQT